ncbi:hypothetical protein CsatB_020666 [Cannabis sativa]
MNLFYSMFIYILYFGNSVTLKSIAQVNTPDASSLMIQVLHISLGSKRKLTLIRSVLRVVEVKRRILWMPFGSARQQLQHGKGVGCGSYHCSSSFDFLDLVKALLSPADYDLFAILSWHIWLTRNKWVHGEMIPKAEDVVEWCTKYVADF